MGDQPHQPPIQQVIGPDRAGGRLDRVLADWRGLSRAAALRLLDAGAVRCNGRTLSRADKGCLLQAGDTLTIDPAWAGRGEAPMPDPSVPLSVLARADGWLAVDKPAGVPVRPHALSETGTVLNALAARTPEIVGVGEGGLRSGVVHRLDNDTSGTLALATTQDAWDKLRKAFADHQVTKRYHALLHGEVPAAGDAVQHLRVARHQPARVESHGDQPAPGTRRCSLGWRVIDCFDDRAAWVEIDLHTGFLHQVRVMMAHLGHPVVGDPLYGQGYPTFGVARQMLHAKLLAFDGVSAEAPLPDDFEQAIDRLRAM